MLRRSQLPNEEGVIMTNEERSAVTRRTVLARGATVTLAAGAVGLVAACGGEAAAETPAATGGGTGSGPDAATEPIATSEIPVGSAKIFPDRNVVIAQPVAGQFKAFSAVCTHGGCTVSRVEGANIVCPCHGGTYSLSDGSVTGGPPPRPLDSVAVTVDGDKLNLG